jgi:glycosyltransferase involved in cell wall biosynthesis
MKILIISSITTHPQNRGVRARVFNLADNLKKLGHTVYFAYDDRENEKFPEADFESMKKYWGDNLYIFPFRPKLNLIGRILRELSTFTISKKLIRHLIRHLRWAMFKDRRVLNLPIDRLYNKKMDIFLSNIKKTVDFDVVIIEQVTMSKALENFDNKVLKIIDTIDAFTDRNIKFVQAGFQPDGYFSTSKKEEAKGLNRADIIIAIQKEEEKYFSKITNKKIVTIGHNVNAVNILRNKEKPKNILFVGSINPGNKYGLENFIKKIFPELLKEFPHLKLFVAGSIGHIIENNQSIIKLEKTIKLEDIYNASDIVINPVCLGTGLKIKSIEAMAFGKALVTTPHGVEGLIVTDKMPFLICKNDDEFVKNIKKLLKDEKFFNEISTNAINFIKKYNLNNIKTLESIIK